MKKARLISLMASLCLLAFYLQAAARPVAKTLSALGGGDCSWFDGH